MAGVLPFGAFFIELLYILNSIWANRIYYVFGFLMLVFLVLVLTTSLVSIIVCYIALCAENYHWYTTVYERIIDILGGGEAFLLGLHAEDMYSCMGSSTM